MADKSPIEIERAVRMMEADLLRQEELVIWIRLLITLSGMALLFAFVKHFNFWPTFTTLIGACAYNTATLLLLKRLPMAVTTITSLILGFPAVTLLLYFNHGLGSLWLLYLILVGFAALRFSLTGALLAYLSFALLYMLVVLPVETLRPSTPEVAVRLVLSLCISLLMGFIVRQFQGQRRRYQTLAFTYRQGSADWEKAAKEAEVRAEVARIVGYSPDLPHVFDSVTTQLKKVVDFDYAGLNILDEQRGIVRVDAFSTGPPIAQREQREVPLAGTGTAWVVANKRTHIAADLATRRWFPRDEIHFGGGLRSAIRVPLTLQDKVLGTLVLLSKRAYAFGENERLILESLAVQIAVLVQNAALLEEKQRRAEESAILVEIGRIISSSLELPKLAELLGNQVGRLVDFDGGSVGILDDAGGTFRLFGLTPDLMELDPLTERLPVEGTRSGWVMAQRKGVVFPDLKEEPHFLLDNLFTDLGRRSYLCQPLIIKDKVIGFLGLGSDQPSHFQQRDLHLIEQIGAQVAVAVQNVALLQATRLWAKQEAAMAEIGRILASALNLDAIWGPFAAELKKMVDFDSLTIAVDEGDNENYRFIGLLGEEMAAYESRRLYPLQGTRLGGVILSGDVCLIGDLKEEGIFPSEEVLVEKGIKSAVILPLKSRGKTIGAMAIGSKRVGNYDGKHIALLERVGMMLASALENYHLFEETQRLAITDGLTGLFNHRYLHEELEREITRARRLSYPLGILFMDLDYFKEFNDAFGHQEGDQALRTLAKVIKDSLRASDTVARYGGEEFVVILPGATEDSLSAVGEKIRRAIETTALIEDQTNSRGRLTISIGATSYPPGDVSSSLLLGKADEALYEAKRLGRNRICIAKVSPTLI